MITCFRENCSIAFQRQVGPCLQSSAIGSTSINWRHTMIIWRLLREKSRVVSIPPNDWLRSSVSTREPSRTPWFLCENWGAERKHVANWPWPPPRVAYYGDNEVYHILTPDITDPELIEAAVAPRHHW